MTITDQQRDELEQVIRRGDPPHLRVKALVLLNVSDGRPIADVARIFRVSRQSVYDWQRGYADGGIDALRVSPGRGRKAQVNLEELTWYVRQSPRNFGIRRTRWTLALLAQAVPSLKGFTPFGVQQALRRAGFRYKRGSPWIHSPDPDYDQKKGLWTRP